MESNPGPGIPNNSPGPRLPPTSPRPLPPRAIRTLPTPPVASSSKEKQVLQESLAPHTKEISSGSQSLLNKSKRIESLPPDYYAPHCYPVLSAPPKQPYDRSPPPDYYAPHSSASCVSSDAAVVSGKKLPSEPDTPVATSSLHHVHQEHHEASTFATAPEIGTVGLAGDSAISSSGPRDVNPKTNSDPASQGSLAPLVPVRRQPEASPSSSSTRIHSPSHQQKSSKSSNRASLIFRNFTHSPSASFSRSSLSLSDDPPAKSEKATSSSTSSIPTSISHSDPQLRSQSSDTGKYSSPAKVTNILSHLDPPTASLKAQTSSNTQPRDNLPYTSPYAKHTAGASVSYMLSSLAPTRDRPSGRTGSQAGQSSTGTQSSLSATSVTTGTSERHSSKSKSKSQSHHELDLPTTSASSSASIELSSDASRSVSPTNVAALVSSLFAPLKPLPPFALLSTTSSNSLNSATSGCCLDAPIGSNMDETNEPPTPLATQRVAAVANLLGGLGPAIHGPSSHSNSSKSDSNCSNSSWHPTEQKHQKSTAHMSESSSTSKLSASVSASMSALSMLNPSNLLRPSMDVKPRPFSSTSSENLAHSDPHEHLGSTSSGNGPTRSAQAINYQSSQNSSPSPSAGASWTNPLMALDSKLKPPLTDTAKARVGEQSQGQTQTPLHSHLNALAPNPKPNQSSRPLPSDPVPKKTRGASNTSTEVGVRKGAAFSRLGSMFGSSKG